jgi:elongation factor Ts
MTITADNVRQLRDETGAGMLDCKKALEKADGDIAKAKEILNEQGLATAMKRAERATAEGVVQSYIHHNQRVGALVEINCESDFVARTEDFKNLVSAVALQVVGANPKYVSKEDMPDGSDEDPKETVLLEQPYLKDESMTVGDLLTQTIQKTGENVRIRRFARFELGR